MKRQVRLLVKARFDLVRSHRWASKHAPLTATRWLARFELALAKLSDNPFVCSIAPESRRSPVELRQFLFGRSRSVYRVVFTVTEDAVLILRIRRAQQKWLTQAEIRESLE